MACRRPPPPLGPSFSLTLYFQSGSKGQAARDAACGCWLLMKRVPGEGGRPSAFPSVFPGSVKGGSSAVHPGRFLLFRLLLFHSVPLRPCDGPKSERSFGARKGKEGAATDDPEGPLNFFKLQPSQAQGAGRSWPAPTACPHGDSHTQLIRPDQSFRRSDSPCNSAGPLDRSLTGLFRSKSWSRAAFDPVLPSGPSRRLMRTRRTTTGRPQQWGAQPCTCAVTRAVA